MRSLLATLFLALAAQAAWAFDFDDVARRARDIAASPFKRAPALPKELQGLDYDRYRDIRYRPERFLWREAKLPFELAFFHQGLYFDQPVRIHEVSAEGVREIRFDPEAFDYGANKLDPAKLKSLG